MEIGFYRNQPATIYYDSQSAVNLIVKPDFNKRPKHFSKIEQYLKDEIQKDRPILLFEGTNNQLSDFLTEGLIGPELKYFLKELKIVNGHLCGGGC